MRKRTQPTDLDSLLLCCFMVCLDHALHPHQLACDTPAAAVTAVVAAAAAAHLLMKRALALSASSEYICCLWQHVSN
jgi:hypothetical protein